jgi:hypothetical protein
MKSLFEKLNLLSTHLTVLDKTFRKKSNYSTENDYKIYKENVNEFERLVKNDKLKYNIMKVDDSDEGEKIHYSFAEEIYSQNDRQMKLADALEYLLFSRGVYYLFQSNRFQKERVSKFIELNLRFVNMLMIYETLTVDQKLRKALLSKLKPYIKNERGFSRLSKWKDVVGFPVTDKRYKKNAPNLYFDSLLPKTAGGLWHEILVYCFILKYDIGYIFPMLLTQKPISLRNKLSPPDLIVLHHKTLRYYGIEIGNLKERQSGGFMAPSGIPVIPIDTRNARMSDRCPSCGKWIGICTKVIMEFSETEVDISRPANEIRCLTDCELFSLRDKIDGKCPYMKFKHKKQNRWNYKFADNKHHHYKCCLSINSNVRSQITKSKNFKQLTKIDSYLRKKHDTISPEFLPVIEKTRKQFSFIKTHSIYYPELVSLHRLNRGNYEQVEETESDE